MAGKFNKKLVLSQKEYLDIVVKQAKATQQLKDKFLKLLEAGADISEYGVIFLKHVNRFRSDAEKIVAMTNIFVLGVTFRKVSEEAEIEKEEEDDRLKKMLEELRKKGNLPSS